jgi:protein Mpv17
MYLSALFANWQLWPMIQLVNFRFVPLRLRVPFTSACGIAWTLWLSLLSAAKGDGEKGVTLEQEDGKRRV